MYFCLGGELTLAVKALREQLALAVKPTTTTML